MTGPAGEKPRGWWRIDAIDKPRRLEFANGLAGDDGEPAPGIEPMAGFVTFEGIDGGTRMTAVTHFVDVEQMEKMLGMGMQEGMAGGDRPDRRPARSGSRLGAFPAARREGAPRGGCIQDCWAAAAALRASRAAFCSAAFCLASA